jgi:hypothetical protein
MLLPPEGLEIIGSEAMSDYFQIFFTDGSILNIFNDFVFENASASELKGRILSGIVMSEADSALVLSLDEGRILVDMRPEAYQGPEALGLYRPGGLPVIWN